MTIIYCCQQFFKVITYDFHTWLLDLPSWLYDSQFPDYKHFIFETNNNLKICSFSTHNN